VLDLPTAARAAFRTVALVLLAAALPAAAAHAQGHAPLIVFDPESKVVLASSQSVRITLCGDQYGVNTSTLVITANGSNVTGSFSEAANPVWPTGYDRCVSRYQYEGTIATTTKSTTLTASVTNNNGNLTGTASAVYSKPPSRYGVAVVSSAQYVDASPGALSVRPFVVTNTGEVTDSLTVIGSCTGEADCTFNTTPVLYLGAGSSTTIYVNYYTSGTVGAVGLARFVVRSKSDAAQADSSFAEVTVKAAAAGGVVLANAPDYLDMSQCVRIGVPGGSIMCGKLVMDHALPATRTMNRTWQPRIIYSAATADPRPTVAANVTITSGAPDSVTAVLTVQGSVVARGKWAGQEWNGSPTRRIALSYDAQGYSTTAYPFTLEVHRWAGGMATQVGTRAGRLVVVNRGGSPHGAGWWMDGVEQLFGLTDGSGALLWVGGDGSHRIYTPVAADVWVAPKMAVPDTLKFLSGLQTYRRLLPGGGWVAFNTVGRHTATVDRNGRQTQFAYDPSSGSLIQIILPVPVGSSAVRGYVISYSGTSIAYRDTTQVASAPMRQVTTSRGSGYNASLTHILDPDNRNTVIQLDPGAPRIITDRIDKRSTRSSFARNGDGTIMSVAALASSGEQVYYATYDDAMRRGQANGVGSVAAPSVPLDSAFTLFDGPRSDVSDLTKFWLDSAGGIARVRNALGQETKVTYSTTWRGVPAETRDAMNVVSTVGLSKTTGLPEQSTVHNFRDDGISATTTVSWLAAVRRPTKVQQPISNPDTMAYDAAGNLLWQRPGSDVNRQVTYSYHTPTKNVHQVTMPYGGVATFGYDTLGNLVSAQTPGGATTNYSTDGYGRVTQVNSPIDAGLQSITTSAYDDMGRVRRTATYGPAMNGRPADSVIVRHEFDEEGNVRNTYRGFVAGGQWRELLHSWFYDALGRVKLEIGGGVRRELVYDGAGNVVQTWNARSLVTTTSYDALNRPYRRITPSVTYGLSSCFVLASQFPCMYTFPTRGSEVVIPADTAIFRYDGAGRMTEADNAFARIRRAYTRSGLLTRDEFRIRKVFASTEGLAGGLAFPEGWASTGGGGGCVGRNCPPVDDQSRPERPTPPRGNPNAVGTTSMTVTEPPSPGVADDFIHAYLIRYHYDLDGRRDSLYYPSQSPCVGSCLRRQDYAYSAVTGALDSIVDAAGKSHRIQYDLRGRAIQTNSPGWQVSMGYDQDDNLTSRTDAWGTVNIVRDALGRMKATNGAIGSSSLYDGLGHLVQTIGVSPGMGWEKFHYDALGNRVLIERNLNDAPYNDNGRRYHTTEFPVDRVTRVTSEPSTDGTLPPYWLDQQFAYDDAGNQSHELAREWNQATNTNKFWETRSYYGADDKLRVFNSFNGLGPAPVISDRSRLPVYEVYWYDALGRRVQVWSRRDVGCNTYWAECASSVKRFVWDGDQVLMEQRATGADTSRGWLDGNPETVAYAHMGGIDAPLAAFKNTGTMVVPHADWRNTFREGHAVYGGLPQINWPGQYEAVDGSPTVPSPNWEWFGDMLVGHTDGSGQKYMRNRYYDPTTGTFTQPDPIGLGGGLNLYGYANGDPVNFFDPFGLDCDKRSKRNEKCDDDSRGDGKKEQHDRCQVAAYLQSYYEELRRDPLRFANPTAFPSEFDFKHGETGDDIFQVGNQWMRADQFGNFAAGYAAQHALGSLGHTAMIVGGILVASQSGSGEHWFDGSSRPMINAGARAARSEQQGSGGNSAGTLMNPTTCGK
jgi:RHS repeat-associated protein